MRIYCPLCTWEPQPDDRWVCAPGCFTVWNTFETRARCPGCAKQWRFTACHACHVMSPHDEWYHDEALDEADQDEVKEPAEVGAGAEQSSGTYTASSTHCRSYRTVPITSVPPLGNRAANVSGGAVPMRTRSESPRTV